MSVEKMSRSLAVLLRSTTIAPGCSSNPGFNWLQARSAVDKHEEHCVDDFFVNTVLSLMGLMILARQAFWYPLLLMMIEVAVTKVRKKRRRTFTSQLEVI